MKIKQRLEYDWSVDNVRSIISVVGTDVWESEWHSLPPKYSGKDGGHWREAEETEALIEMLTNEAKTVIVDALRKLLNA